MAVMLKQLIDKFEAMEKIANETLAADPEALVGVDSMPGSEHDQKVPAEAKKPDEEVAQGQPAGATSAEGAVNGGDAKPLNEGKLEMDQPLENPTQKPLISDDALTAKTANDHLVQLVGDLLKDLKTTKQAACGCSEGATHAAAPAKPAKPAEKKDGKKDDEKKDGKDVTKIALDQETIDKIAAAQAAFMLGRSAADSVIKKQAEEAKKGITPENARALIKASCVKIAQEQGLSQADAEAAADNAMAVAGVAPEQAAVADAAAADAAAADAGANAAAADAGAAEAGLPEDVTEQELATAIVDLVQSGELDIDTAKALVEEIAGDGGAAGPTEDQAAEIIAQGLESGEITPEQAQQIAAAVEGGAADAAAADAGAADAEAQGAADAAAAIQDAQDEAKGAADAEAAIKDACERLRADTLSKVASHIVSKRAEKQAAAQPKKGDRVLSKVAGILKAKKEEAEKQAAAQSNPGEAKYIEGFQKKAAEMGVDPKALAQYFLATHAAKEQATK